MKKNKNNRAFGLISFFLPLTLAVTIFFACLLVCLLAWFESRRPTGRVGSGSIKVLVAGRGPRALQQVVRRR